MKLEPWFIKCMSLPIIFVVAFVVFRLWVAALTTCHCVQYLTLKQVSRRFPNEGAPDSHVPLFLSPCVLRGPVNQVKR